MKQSLASLSFGAPTTELPTHLSEAFYASLTAPLDDLWDSIIHQSMIGLIFLKDQVIGYYSLDDEGNLVHFFVNKGEEGQSRSIFERLIRTKQPPKVLVETQNPLYLELAISLGKKIKVHSYIFEEDPQQAFSPPDPWPDSTLSRATLEELDELVIFCHQSIGNPISWIEPYVQDQLEKENVYLLRRRTKIMGMCEVRQSLIQPTYANLGMIVHKELRNQGLGTYLIRQARALAQKQGWACICSCEKRNKASRIAIERTGFRQKSLVLEVKL